MSIINFLILLPFFVFAGTSLIKNNENYIVKRILPHDNTCYTQGLIKEKDIIYESCGLYKSSSLKKLSYPDMKVLKQVYLKNSEFAEGIGICSTLSGQHLFQLTYREKVINQYRYHDLKFISAIKMSSSMREGWGLSNYDEFTLIATDGSHKIFFLDCMNDLKVKHFIQVVQEGSIVQLLNDLIYAKGYIWCIQYISTKVYKIDPKSGIVIQVYDLKELKNYEIQKGTLTEQVVQAGDVLNGISYDSERDLFIITGKRWSNYYEIIFN